MSGAFREALTSERCESLDQMGQNPESKSKQQLMIDASPLLTDASDTYTMAHVIGRRREEEGGREGDRGRGKHRDGRHVSDWQA